MKSNISSGIGVWITPISGVTSAPVSTAPTPGEGAGGPRVDAREHGVRVGTPDEGEGQRALQAHVVDIGIAAGDELRVLEPLERTADVLDGDEVPLPGAGARGVLTGGHGTTAGGGQKRRQWPAAGSGATRSIPPWRARR